MMAERSEFLFLTYEFGKPVEVLRPGTFVDRHGREVVIRLEDLRKIVENFEAGAAGQDVPVDIQHEKREAAGWVKRVWLEGEKLMAEIDWNELGKRLVGEGIFRYVSATLDLGRKVLKSVSLVNFPAVKGLKPVELSEGVYTFEEQNALDRLAEAARALERAAARLMGGAGDEDEPDVDDGDGDAEASEPDEDEENQAAVELAGNIQNIIRAWPKWAGSWRACVRELRGKQGISEPEALCAWLHKQAEGKWPAEGAEYEGYQPSDAELQALVEILSEQIAGGGDMAEQQTVNVAELREQIRQEVEAQLKGQFEAEMREREERIRREFELREQVEAVVTELAEGDYGLGAQTDEIREVLLAIEDDELRQRVVNLLKAKVVEFRERGSAGEGRLDDVAEDAVGRFDAKVRELMESEGLTYDQAYLKAARQFPELAVAYLAEMEG